MRAIFWPIAQFLIIMFGSVSYTLLYFLYFAQAKIYSGMLEFTLVLFGSSLVGILCFDPISRKINPKYLYVLGLYLQAVVYSLASSQSVDIKVLAALYGIGYALQAEMLFLTAKTYLAGVEVSKTAALTQVLKGIIAITTPIIVAVLIQSLGYSSSLMVLSITTIIACFVLIISMRGSYVRVDYNESIYALLYAIHKPFLRSIALNSFILGTVLAFGWGLTDVLLLQRFDGISSWTNISIALAIVGVILSIAVAKLDFRSNPGLSKFLATLPFFIFSAGALWLIVYDSAESFVAFLVAYKILSVLTLVVSASFIAYRIGEWDVELKYGDLPISLFISFFQYLGMFFIIGVAYMIPAELFSADLIAFLLFFTSLIGLRMFKKI